MVGDNAEGDVDFFLFVVTSRSSNGKRRTIFFAGKFFESTEERRENIALVIRNSAREVFEVFGALHDACHTLKAHARVYVTSGEG